MKNHKQSDKQKIASELKRGFIITVQSVLKSIRTQELRTYISVLKREGMNIKGEWVSKRGKRFKQYHLVK